MDAFNRAGAALRAAMFLLALGLHVGEARSGSQMYEPLSASARHALQKAVSDQAVDGNSFQSRQQARSWILAMSPRLQKKLPDSVARIEFLRTVHYEATRAGLDPQLVLAVIQVESNFRKYAVSTAGARGYMQVMPFWLDLIGNSGTQPVPPAHQPALRLRDPAPLPRHRTRQPHARARPLQRQPRQALVSIAGADCLEERVAVRRA